MDITANLVTTSQLDSWMQASVQRVLATVDEWCYAMNDIISHGSNNPSGDFNPNAPGCPQIDPPGSGLGTGMDAVFICGGMLGDGSNRSTLPQISSQQFLDCLRTAQINASVPGPGGSTSPGGTGKPTPPKPPASTTPTAGQGVFGMTNCAVCQQLAANPVLVLIIVVAGYYFFFEK
jgi:hypothetical protein